MFGMTTKIKSFVVASLVLLTLGAPVLAMADQYPDKPIDVYIPAGAGGGTDLIARAIAGVIPKYLGQALVCINNGKAGGAIAEMRVARAKPDGYTLGFGYGGGSTVYLPLFRKVQYDPLVDLKPLNIISSFPLSIMVQADSPYKTLPDLVKAAKTNPNKISVAHSTAGSGNHLMVLSLEQASGASFNKIAFKGVGAGVTALLGGHVDMATGPAFVAAPYVKSGKLRVLALSSKERNKKYWPDLPTFTEYGYNVVINYLKGFSAPANLPDDISKKLIGAFEKTVKDKSFQNIMNKMNTPISYVGPAEAKKLVAEEIEVVSNIIKKAKLKTEK